MRACLGINIELPSLSSCGQGTRRRARLFSLFAPVVPMLNPGCPSVWLPSFSLVIRVCTSVLWAPLGAPSGLDGADCSLNLQAWTRSLPWERRGKCPLCTGGCRTLASRTGFCPDSVAQGSGCLSLSEK